MCLFSGEPQSIKFKSGIDVAYSVHTSLLVSSLSNWVWLGECNVGRSMGFVCLERVGQTVFVIISSFHVKERKRKRKGILKKK